MNATDLMIGSIVRCYDQECKVIAISESHPTLELPNGNSTIVPLDLIEPIPLTEEWLVRAGFEDGQMEIPTARPDIRDNNCLLTINKHGCSLLNETYEFEMDLKRPDFVHQLQNLYHALTGKELEFTPKQ